MIDHHEDSAETGSTPPTVGSLRGSDAPSSSPGTSGRLVRVDEPVGALMPWRDRFSTSWASPRQVGARVAVAVAAVMLAAVPFCLLLLSVESRWRPLLVVDDSARDDLHGYALAHPLFVALMRAASTSGSAVAWQVVTVLLAGFLLWRRRVRVALFVVVTIAGSSLVNSLVKASVHRARPVVDHPLLHEPGQSFPSGHAQAAAAGYAVLLVLVLPHLNGVGRRVAGMVAVVMTVAIGFSRVALAAHYVSDVVAAYLLGLGWVAVMAAAFQVWRHGSLHTDTTDPTAEAAKGG